MIIIRGLVNFLSEGSHYQEIINSGNARHAITWSNDDQVRWGMYATPKLNWGRVVNGAVRVYHTIRTSVYPSNIRARTRWPAKYIFNCICLKWILCISISLKFVHSDLVQKMLLRLMVWRSRCDWTTGRMVNQFIDAYLCFQASPPLGSNNRAEFKSKSTQP